MAGIAPCECQMVVCRCISWRAESGFTRRHMNRFRETLIGAACLMASASLVSCKRSADTSSPGSTGRAGSNVGEDMKGVARETEKTAKDIGRATEDLAG